MMMLFASITSLGRNVLSEAKQNLFINSIRNKMIEKMTEKTSKQSNKTRFAVFYMKPSKTGALKETELGIITARGRLRTVIVATATASLGPSGFSALGVVVVKAIWLQKSHVFQTATRAKDIRESVFEDFLAKNGRSNN